MERRTKAEERSKEGEAQRRRVSALPSSVLAKKQAKEPNQKKHFFIFSFYEKTESSLYSQRKNKFQVLLLKKFD